MESKINDCMWHTFEYAAFATPQIVIMESVQQAYSKGAALMRRLVGYLNGKTGMDYKLTHVLQDNLSVGGGARRPRYFLVASRVPFFVKIPELGHVPSLEDVIGDLSSAPLQWSPQHLPSPPTWWSAGRRTPSDHTDGHIMHENAHERRIMSLMTDPYGAPGIVWMPGMNDLQMLQQYWTRFGKLPPEWDYPSLRRDEDGTRIPKSELLVKSEFERKGFSGVVGWDPAKPGRVFTGAGPGQSVNVIAQRLFTYREVARVMGFPDSLMIAPMKDTRLMHAFWGKQTSVDPARWICEAARDSISGITDGGVQGELDEHGDRVINITHLWKPVWRKQHGVFTNEAEAATMEAST
jgi:site-specific DNA-cytosine methylase